MRFQPVGVASLIHLALGASCTVRPFDDTEEAARTQRDVTIIRDEKGVPHVHAKTVPALFYGVGYAQAQDRLWQAELLRRSATGTLAEWIGSSSLVADIQARLVFGPEARREALVAASQPETMLVLAAYVAGINAWIAQATAAGTLPAEYAELGVAPRPWTVDDSVAIFMLLASQMGWSGGDELSNATAYTDLIDRLGPAEGVRAFTDTHFLDDPSAPTTVPAVGTSAARAAPPAPSWLLSIDAASVAAELRANSSAQAQALHRVGLQPGPMSNAILIGSSMSADGHALLLGGPQMGYGAPQINHEMGLHGAGFEVTGTAIAGVPLTLVGVGPDYAWSLTSGGSDNTDIFVEQLNPSDPAQYWYEGSWRDLDCRVETFVVMGAEPTSQTLCRSVHGPILASMNGFAYAMANPSFGAELASYEAWLDLARSGSFDEFRASLSRVAYNFNVFYADARRTIAYWHVGAIPLRASGANPFFPQLGDGTSDWQGMIPFEDLPNVMNPAQGWLVNWDNKPASGWSNSSAGFWSWGPVHRVNTLRALLEQQPPRSVSVATLEEINRRAGLTTDSPSGSSETVIVSTMLDQMLDVVDVTADPRLPNAVAVLRGWDWLQTDENADQRYDSAAVAITNAWWEATLDQIFRPKLGAAIDDTLCAQILYRLLAGEAAALPVQADYLQGATIGSALTQSLIAALDELQARFASPDTALWLAPIAEIEWGPGGIGTVANTLWMNRGTYDQIVHLGRGASLFAENVVAPGQSGDYRSTHFADQLELYTSWTYKPMRLSTTDQRSHAESIVYLEAP